MSMFKNLMLAAAVAVPATVAVGQAHAQVTSVAVVDLPAAMANSKAWKAADQLLASTYKTQLDQAAARKKAIEAELQPLITSLETARRQPNANQTTLRNQAETIDKKAEAGNQELATLTSPYARARAYALEQIQGQLQPAVEAATKKKNVGIVLTPNSVAFVGNTAADLTDDVTAELDRILPTVSITPPAGWVPAAQRQQAAQQGQAPAPAPAAAAPAPAAPAKKQPSGR